MVNKMKLMKVRDRLVEIHNKLDNISYKHSNEAAELNSLIDWLGNTIDEFSDIIHNDK